MTFLRRLAVWQCLRVLRPYVPAPEFSVADTVLRLKAERQLWTPLCTLSRRLHSESLSSEATEVELNKREGGDAGIAEVVMCRQHARNSLGKVFVRQMRELVSTLHHDSTVRVVVFRSTVPRVFCAGADLKERAQMANAEAEHFVHGLRSLMSAIAMLPMPTIAAVDGYALGGGLELALACDLRTAAFTAQMGLIETTRGLLPGAGDICDQGFLDSDVSPDSRCVLRAGRPCLVIYAKCPGGSQRLPRAVGFAVAKEMIFTGQQLGGERALQLGLVNRAVEQNSDGDAAYTEALGLAREILPQGPIAVRMAKEAMTRGIEVDIASGMAIEGMCYARVIPTRDRQEGMAAFIEKRPPQYIGE